MQMTKAKPCLALMGEFSAGKSTLANLLIGENPLPVRIIATQLPPVKISFGTGAPYSVNLDGTKTDIALDDFEGLDLDNIRYLQMFSAEDFLRHCDLLDMPGISDPNMDSDVWERIIDTADGVIWCSHAVQAWRQSEAAVWAGMSEHLYGYSLLLLTQIDKINSPADRDRIVKRVQRETVGLFRNVLPISLLAATSEQDDIGQWAKSGAGALVDNLVALLNDLNAGQVDADATAIPALRGPQQAQSTEDVSERFVQPRRFGGVRHARE